MATTSSDRPVSDKAAKLRAALDDCRGALHHCEEMLQKAEQGFKRDRSN
jgi:hypothetical protein